MEIGKMEDFTMIIWKSRCACKVNCCGLFRCERSPPPDEGASDGEEDKKVQSKPTIQPQQVEEVVVERDSLIP